MRYKIKNVLKIINEANSLRQTFFRLTTGVRFK